MDMPVLFLGGPQIAFAFQSMQQWIEGLGAQAVTMMSEFFDNSQTEGWLLRGVGAVYCAATAEGGMRPLVND
jgi:hypothetical protein